MIIKALFALAILIASIAFAISCAVSWVKVGPSVTESLPYECIEVRS